MRLRFLQLGSTVAILILVCANAGTDDSVAPPPPHETATFSMYCYWTGEATLGRVDGVIASRIGHWGGSEIVQVDYDPTRTDIAALVAALERQKSFYSVVVGDEAAQREAARAVDPDRVAQRSGSPHFIESKYTLRRRHPELYALDLTEQQAVALNSWSYFGGEMPDVLTAEQQKGLESR